MNIDVESHSQKKFKRLLARHHPPTIISPFLVQKSCSAQQSNTHSRYGPISAMTTNILPIFWNLASSSKDTRIPASAELISSLEGFQRSYLETKEDKEDSSEDEDDEKDEDDDEEEDSDAESGIEVDGDEDMDEQPQDGEAKALDKVLDKENADDVVYAVKRLIRGLGSSRDSSRLGFAVALTEVGRLVYITNTANV